MKNFEPIPLPDNAAFDDLLFRRHPDGLVGHLQALHALPDGRAISVTIGGGNFGTAVAPYEMMDAAGEVHAPLTEDDVTMLLRTQWPQAPGEARIIERSDKTDRWLLDTLGGERLLPVPGSGAAGVFIVKIPMVEPQEAMQPATDGALYVILDGPPHGGASRFADIEDGAGRSVNAGNWIERPNGTWALKITWPGQ